jgi:hypothetical protein
MATFNGDALLFESLEDEDVTFFTGERPIEITLPGTKVTIGDDDDEIELTDLETGRTVELDDIEVTLFAEEQTGANRRIYADFDGEIPGEDIDGVFNDEPDVQFTYRVLIEGDPLPDFEEGRPLNELLDEAGLFQAPLEEAPGFPDFNDGEELDLTDFVGLELGGPIDGDPGDDDDDVPGIPGDLDSAEAVTLLYEVAFDRRPEESGLNYWADRVEDGAALDQVAFFFLTSDEFTARTAEVETLSAEELVTEFYENGLDRQPDPGGAEFWTDALIRDGASKTLANFATSDGVRDFVESDDQIVQEPDGDFVFA